jgi:hypothetical protein
MNFKFVFLCLTFLTLAGCSTNQDVTLIKGSMEKPIRTIAQVLDEGNSTEMNQNLVLSLHKQGLTVNPSQPKATRKSTSADALISYIDVWRWDIVMYLQSISIKVYDARSGDLIAIGEWKDSKLHGFRDSRKVVESLVQEIFSKIRSITSNSTTSQATGQ